MAMTTYELMVKLNHYLIKGGSLNENQKRKIIEQFLSAITPRNITNYFYTGIMETKSEMCHDRQMCPLFFIPSHSDGSDGYKLDTILSQHPKTRLYSANMYELEIIRVLHLLAPDDFVVMDMVAESLNRLKCTCFGNGQDGHGELFDISLVALRFIAAASSEVDCMEEIISNYYRHMSRGKLDRISKWYFWLCLSELPKSIANPQIVKYSNEALEFLTLEKSIANENQDTTMQRIFLYITRNMLCRLPEYEYIKARCPYLEEKGGLLRFNESLFIKPN